MMAMWWSGERQRKREGEERERERGGNLFCPFNLGVHVDLFIHLAYSLTIA